MSRIPGSESARPRGYPRMSRIPQGPPDGRRLPPDPRREPDARRIPLSGMSEMLPDGRRLSRIQPPSGSFQQRPSGTSRIAPPRSFASAGSSRIPGEGATRTIFTGVSHPPYAAVSKTVMAGLTKPNPQGGKTSGLAVNRTTITGPSASNVRKGVSVSITQSIPTLDKAKKALPKPSRIQRFDRTVTEELSRRKEPIPKNTTTSDTVLLEAVDRLARAEAAHSFAGAVAAAEAAAADTPDPTAAEIAAAEGARSYQAELVDVITQDLPGEKPIQVIGYMGITRPKYPTKG